MKEKKIQKTIKFDCQGTINHCVLDNIHLPPQLKMPKGYNYKFVSKIQLSQRLFKQ